VVFFYQGLGTSDDILSLVAIEAGGFDDRFEVGEISLGHRFRIGVLFEQAGRDLVYRFIGALGRENGGDQQLKRVGVDKSAVGMGVEFGQGEGDALGGFKAGGSGRSWHASIILDRGASKGMSFNEIAFPC